MRVLVVDDNEADRYLVRRALESAHPGMVDYREASTLAEAHAAMGSFQPQIVFLDVNLPNGQGVESVKSISGRAPIIVCSGDDGFSLTPEQKNAYDVLDVIDKATLFSRKPPILLRVLSRGLNSDRLRKGLASGAP